jgi:nanoRNase/pAp phosphatase (c-di-AMP/oligoRNAs hydrolase)
MPSEREVRRKSTRQRDRSRRVTIDHHPPSLHPSNMGAFYDEIPTSPDLASWIAEQSQ